MDEDLKAFFIILTICISIVVAPFIIAYIHSEIKYNRLTSVVEKADIPANDKQELLKRIILEYVK